MAKRNRGIPVANDKIPKERERCSSSTKLNGYSIEALGIATCDCVNAGYVSAVSSLSASY